jgi:hypothetical protein
MSFSLKPEHYFHTKQKSDFFGHEKSVIFHFPILSKDIISYAI